MCSVVEDLSLFLMVMLKIKDIIMKILYLFSITNNTNIITIHIHTYVEMVNFFELV